MSTTNSAPSITAFPYRGLDVAGSDKDDLQVGANTVISHRIDLNDGANTAIMEDPSINEAYSNDNKHLVKPDTPRASVRIPPLRVKLDSIDRKPQAAQTSPFRTFPAPPSLFQPPPKPNPNAETKNQPREQAERNIGGGYPEWTSQETITGHAPRDRVSSSILRRSEVISAYFYAVMLVTDMCAYCRS